MMHRLLFLAFLLAACQNTHVTNKDNSNTNASTAAPADDPQTWWKNKNCPRGVPEPTFSPQNPNLTSRQFLLSKEGGFESARLFSGDSLFVDDTGCNYYSLTYTLKSFTPEAAKGDAAYWYQRASDLFLGLQDSKVPFDLQDLSARLANMARQNAKEDVEIPLETGNRGKSYALLSQFGKLPSGNGGFMIFRLSIGPM